MRCIYLVIGVRVRAVTPLLLLVQLGRLRSSRKKCLRCFVLCTVSLTQFLSGRLLGRGPLLYGGGLGRTDAQNKTHTDSVDLDKQKIAFVVGCRSRRSQHPNIIRKSRFSQLDRVLYFLAPCKLEKK